MFIEKRTKFQPLLKKLITFSLLANLLVLPLVVNFTHICCEEPHVDLQHNTHCHHDNEAKAAFAKSSEFKNQLCYACIYSAISSVIRPINTNPDYNVIFDTLNPLAEQIFTSSSQSSQSGRGPPFAVA